MLKKQNRLKAFHLSSPRIVSSPLFTLKIGENEGEESRFAFIVSKKIDKRAVVRNSVKRKVRSCIEQISGNIHEGKDFVFYLRSEAVNAPREIVLEEINKLFTVNKLLK